MADNMTAEQLQQDLREFLERLTTYRGKMVNGNLLYADAMHFAGRLSALPAQGVPELIGWYRAYATWSYGQSKPNSTRHEFHPGTARPNDPEDEAPEDWEPVYLLGTVPIPPAPKANDHG